MGKTYAIVRYDQNRMDEYYDPQAGEFVETLPNTGYESREQAEDVMFSLEKDSAYDYSVERVG